MSDYPYEAIVVLGDKDEIIEYTGDEVVRCKDCEHFEAINNDDHGWCKRISDLPCGISVRYDNDYCSYGERREA